MIYGDFGDQLMQRDAEYQRLHEALEARGKALHEQMAQNVVIEIPFAWHDTTACITRDGWLFSKVTDDNIVWFSPAISPDGLDKEIEGARKQLDILLLAQAARDKYRAEHQ